MACALVVAPMHFHAPTEAHLEAFLNDLDEGFSKVLEDLLKVHSNIEVIDGPPDPDDAGDDEEDDNPWQVS